MSFAFLRSPLFWALWALLGNLGTLGNSWALLGTLGTLGHSGHSWELLGTLGTLGCIRGVYRYYLSIGIDTPTFPCERDWCRTMIARTVGADEHLAGDLHHDFHGRAKWMAARGGGGAKQLRRGGGGGGGGGVCFSWWVGG